MADLAGTAVETAFSELFSLVKEVVKTIAAFGPELEKIESTLNEIDPIIKQWDEYNRRLDCDPKEMGPIIDLFVKGKGLVKTCSKIDRLNILKKHEYSKKLTEFDEEVRRKFAIYLQLVNVVASKTTLLNVKETGEDVTEIKGVVKETGGDVKEIMEDVKETGGDVKEIKEGAEEDNTEEGINWPS